MALLDPKRLKMNETIGASCSTITKDMPIPSVPYFTFTSSKLKDIVKMKAFVDKTKMIETIFEDTPVIVITAPQHFGKTAIIDMVKTFVEIQTDLTGMPIGKENESSNYHIFRENNLLIYQDTEFFNRHFATFPVIHVCFKNVAISCSNHDDVLFGFKKVLHEAFKQHPYLLTSDKLTSDQKEVYQMYFGDNFFQKLTRIDIKYGLTFLSKCLYKHFNKRVFALIDEYDAAINNAMFKKEVDVYDIHGLLSAIFSDLLKGNEYLKRALLTGISFFATYELCIPNNIERYMFLQNHPFVDYYGLTEAETDKLLSDFNIEEEMKKKVKFYYNGYYTNNGKKIFPTWSVLHYLQSKQLQSYWQESGLVIGLNEALHSPLIRYEIEKLFHNVDVEILTEEVIELKNVIGLKDALVQNRGFTDANLYLNLLLQQGYLTYKKICTGVYRCPVAIPNPEILQQFKNELKNYYSACPNEIMEKCAAVVDKISANANEEIYNELIETLEQVIFDTGEKIYEHGRVFHSLLFAILCKSKFEIGDEMRLSNGLRLDLMVTRGTTGVVFEIKHKQDSKKALGQIIDEKYDRVFDDNKVKDKIYVGLNVDENRKVTVALLINTLKIEEVKLFPL